MNGPTALSGFTHCIHAHAKTCFPLHLGSASAGPPLKGMGLLSGVLWLRGFSAGWDYPTCTAVWSPSYLSCFRFLLPFSRCQLRVTVWGSLRPLHSLPSDYSSQAFPNLLGLVSECLLSEGPNWHRGATAIIRARSRSALRSGSRRGVGEWWLILHKFKGRNNGTFWQVDCIHDVSKRGAKDKSRFLSEWLERWNHLWMRKGRLCGEAGPQGSDWG